jgi:single-strand DNA-binding protein
VEKMNDTTVTVVGNVVDNPQLRTTNSGIDVVNFRVASTARRRDKVTGEWGDGDSVYLSVTCWRDLGANVLQSVVKGDPVIVTGRLFTRRYERDGQPRSAYEVDALAVGLDLARGTATFRRTRSGAAATQAAEAAGSRGLAPVLRFVGRDDAGRDDAGQDDAGQDDAGQDDGAAGAGGLRSAAP